LRALKTNNKIKMSFKKNTVERESWINILNDIFNPTFGFVQIWVEKTQHF